MKFSIDKPIDKKAKQVAYIINLDDNGKDRPVFLDERGNVDEVTCRSKDDKEFFPCFETGSVQNSRIYISGKSGSGKTSMANRCTREIKLRHPEKKIYVMSTYDHDESMDKYIGGEIVRLALKNHKLEDVTNSVLIIDDPDSIKDKDVRKEVYDFANTALQSGRHYGIDIIFINHTIKNGPWTKYVIQECNYYVFFPGSGNDTQIANFCKDYCGLTRKALKKIRRTYNSRWIVVYSQYPTFVITQKEIYFPSRE